MTDSQDLFRWLRDLLPAGVDLTTLAGSDGRIRRAYQEYLDGYTIDPEELIVIVNDNFTVGGSVQQSLIPFYSMCAHHFLPFWGTATVRYWPTTKLIGIGKLPRLVHAFSARLTMQEVIARDIAEFLLDAVEASRVEVELEARHLCVEARGPKAVGSITKSSFFSER